MGTGDSEDRGLGQWGQWIGTVRTVGTVMTEDWDVLAFEKL